MKALLVLILVSMFSYANASGNISCSSPKAKVSQTKDGHYSATVKRVDGSDLNLKLEGNELHNFRSSLSVGTMYAGTHGDLQRQGEYTLYVETLRGEGTLEVRYDNKSNEKYRMACEPKVKADLTCEARERTKTFNTELFLVGKVGSVETTDGMSKRRSIIELTVNETTGDGNHEMVYAGSAFQETMPGGDGESSTFSLVVPQNGKGAVLTFNGNEKAVFDCKR